MASTVEAMGRVHPPMRWIPRKGSVADRPSAHVGRWGYCFTGVTSDPPRDFYPAAERLERAIANAEVDP